MLSEEDVEFIDSEHDDDDPFLVEAKSPKSRYLVYEEKWVDDEKVPRKFDLIIKIHFSSEIENQPKMNYNLSETSVKINSTSHFNFNPDLKNFVESYLDSSPNLDIIKITDQNAIREIEKVLAINDDVKNSSATKRQRMPKQTFAVGSQSINRIAPRIIAKQQPSSSRLLNALSGHRLGNVTVNRVSSNSGKREHSNPYRKWEN